MTGEKNDCVEIYRSLTGIVLFFYFSVLSTFSPKHNKITIKRNPWSLIKQLKLGNAHWLLQRRHPTPVSPSLTPGARLSPVGRTRSVAVGLCLCLVRSVRHLILKYRAGHSGSLCQGCLLTSVLVSCGSCNKLPQSWWIKTTDIHSLTVLEAKSLKSGLLT